MRKQYHITYDNIESNAVYNMALGLWFISIRKKTPLQYWLTCGELIGSFRYSYYFSSTTD